MVHTSSVKMSQIIDYKILKKENVKDHHDSFIQNSSNFENPEAPEQITSIFSRHFRPNENR